MRLRVVKDGLWMTFRPVFRFSMDFLDPILCVYCSFIHPTHLTGPMSYAAHVLSHRRLRRRHILGGAVLTMIVLWAVFWGVTSFKVHGLIETWKEKQAFTYTDSYTNGTPWAVHTHLKGFEAKNPSGHEVRSSEAVIYMNLWDWRTLSGKLKNDPEGKINGTPFAADTIKFAIAYPEFEPLNDTETGLFLSLHAFDLTFKPEKPFLFGNAMAQLSFDLRVMGTPPDFSNVASVKAWNDASGVLEFDQLDMVWGPMTISAKGTVGLNPALQPEGAFSGRIDGLDIAINQIVSNGILDKRKEALLRSSLQVLSRPSSAMNAATPIVPMTVQGGGLYLGPVKIMEIPALQWPENQGS